VTDKGIGRWQEVEYREAFDKHVEASDFPVVLLLMEGQPAPRLPFLKQLHWIVTRDPASEKDVGRLIDAVVHGGDPETSERWRYTSPYRGLSAMEEKDSDYFFGREQETIEVLRVLASQPRRLPILLGNSGVGKSSLAQAGVIAALRRQAWPEGAGGSAAWPETFKQSRSWCFLTLKPGAEPMRALVESFLRTWEYEAIDPKWEEWQKEWVDRLQDGRASLRGLLDATERRYEEIGKPKLPAFFLYVDQAEELYVRAKDQRRRFSEVVRQGVVDPRLLALMSMRSDFLGQLQNDEALFAAHCKIDVPPLRREQLSRVITKPAKELGARFESEQLVAIITERTLEDSATDVGALPLLSYTLDDMWTEMVGRGDGILRLPAGAFELGGVLAERANSFLNRNPQWEAALRRVLTIRLTTVRTEGDPARRRARRSEFSEDEWRLVSELADHPNRLLVTAAPEGAEPYAEVAHEALFRRWDKLRDWISAEREFWHGGRRSTMTGGAGKPRQRLPNRMRCFRGWRLRKQRTAKPTPAGSVESRARIHRAFTKGRARPERGEAPARNSARASARGSCPSPGGERSARTAGASCRGRMARLRAEREAHKQKGRAAAEEAARVRAEEEARKQGGLTRRARWMTVGAAIAGILLASGTYFGVCWWNWSQIRDSMEPSDFEHHLATFWLSPFASEAKSKLAGLAEFERIQKSKSRSISELEEFADKYPTSLYYSFVRLRLRRLQAIESGRYTLVLAGSSTHVLQAEEFNALDCSQLYTARNEIYYAVGYCFLTEKAINQFQTRAECSTDCKMIKNFNNLAQDVLSPIEYTNIGLLLNREKEKVPSCPSASAPVCN
jgi:hypothetical protein